MSTRTEPLSDEVYDYLVAHGSAPDPIMADLIAETRATLPDRAHLQIAPEQARFLTLLARIVRARYAVEVGTFTGLSALAIARGLPADGKLTCCDLSAEYTAVAQRYWARAGVADRVELRLGPAAETLRTLPDQPHLELAFIDADKRNNSVYWSEIVPRMRPGGVILVDNVLRHGRVVSPRPDDPDDLATVRFNEEILTDDRVEVMILPLADGVTLARRK